MTLGSLGNHLLGELYRREVLTVSTDTRSTETLLYIENYEDVGVPGGEYLRKILVGAEHFGLPSAWIEALAAWA